MMAAPFPAKREARRSAPLPIRPRFREFLNMKETSPGKDDYKMTPMRSAGHLRTKSRDPWPLLLRVRSTSVSVRSRGENCVDSSTQIPAVGAGVLVGTAGNQVIVPSITSVKVDKHGIQGRRPELTCWP